ncbi:FAD-binding oxidoreductase [Paenibacillus tarimensis]
MAWSTGLTGHVVVQGSPGYEEARRDYNARFSKFPKAIVYCRNAQDVANAVLWARRNALPFRIRSGGHSYEAYSLIDNGLVIDVSGMNSIHIDKANGIARIGAGVRLMLLYETLWKYGLAVPGGTCPAVGISGLMLGGGFGYLSRLLGMTCDSLLEVEMVNAQGNLIRANDRQHSSLLWACRGGGDGSFGVITSLTFRVYPIGDLAHYSMTWDFADLEKIVQFWQAWAPHTDPRLSSLLKLPARNQGDILSLGVFNGLEKELRTLVRPLQEAVPPKTVAIHSASWINIARMLAGIPVRQEKFKNTSAYVYEPFSDSAVETLIQHLSTSPGTGNLVVFDAYGGAIGRIPTDATAFVHREALFVMQYQAYWGRDTDEAENISWVERFRKSMLPFTRGAYRDYCDSQISDWPTAYFGSNITRLRQVKQIYDPDNVFRFEQSIPPLLPR